ncbi:MAG: hypothetical protein KJO29_00620 [Bacteroidia bacterium]|nr:hypothetical protein [Bacteroidia bacterium]
MSKTLIDYFKNTKTFIRYRYWEYWPIWLVYLPVIPVALFYAFRMRRFFFFSNVNPIFKTGAFLGASKFKILSQIPEQYIPQTILIRNTGDRIRSAIDQLRNSGISYPLIVKPDVGERGLLVELINNESELVDYLSANEIDILIQEYITHKNECGIFYVRKPSEKKGKIVSVGLKAFFNIIGDGQSTVRQLMERIPRYRLQIERFEERNKSILDQIPEEDEVLQLEPIGNHSRGTTFIDGNHLISKELDDLFDNINAQMPDVYYGRFDVKYNKWEDLVKGVEFKILEMNGVASEPIHIYDQAVPIRDKYKCLFGCWKTLFEISNIQKSRGILPIKLPVAFREFMNYKNYIKSINLNWRNETGTSFGIS